MCGSLAKETYALLKDHTVANWAAGAVGLQLTALSAMRSEGMVWKDGKCPDWPRAFYSVSKRESRLFSFRRQPTPAEGHSPA